MSTAPYRYRQSAGLDLSVEERVSLAELVAEAKPTARLHLQVGKRRPVLIPQALQARIIEVLQLASSGQPVSVQALTKTLSTQQAADRLGVSRPHVVSLIESGILPATKTGTHRRIRPCDLAAYEAKQVKQRSQALSGLMKATRQLGLGY
ncbi:MAG: excisionase family DNA-binding protein [Verrucomicrobiota bacterium]|jgi:excisionase family DNA binding protein